MRRRVSQCGSADISPRASLRVPLRDNSVSENEIPKFADGDRRRKSRSCSLIRDTETVGRVANAPYSREFRVLIESYEKSKTCWLGREDSNLRMAESKSAALPLGYAPSRGSFAAMAGGT